MEENSTHFCDSFEMLCDALQLRQDELKGTNGIGNRL